MKIKKVLTAGLIIGAMIAIGGWMQGDPFWWSPIHIQKIQDTPEATHEDQNTEEVSYILTEPETEDDGTMTMIIEDENTGDCYGAVCIAYTENGTPYVGGIYTINDEIVKEMIEEGSDPETVKEITKEANNEVWEGIEDDLENLNIAESATIAIEWEQ